MILEETNSEIIELPASKEEVEISYPHPKLNSVKLSAEMPIGFAQRARNQHVEDRDVQYIEWVISEYTDWELYDMLENNDIPNGDITDLVVETVDIVTGTERTVSDDMPSFLEEGTAGVR